MLSLVSFLSLLSLAGCGGGSSDDGPAPEQAQTQPAATTVPEPLRGQWETVLTYVPASYSGPYTSAFEGGDGSMGVNFHFWPDGRYKHVWRMMQSYFGGNCFRSAVWEEVGTLSGTGPEFIFNPGRAVYSSMDTCGRSQYVDPVPMIPASHTLTLERDATGWPLLRMSFPSGDMVLEKCRRCQ